MENRYGTSRRVARLELAAVAIVGILHLVFEEVLHQKTLFVATAVIGWTTYLAWRVRSDRGVLREWGLVRPTPADFRAPLVVCAIGTVALAAVGLARGTFILSINMIPLLLLYPVWGVVQQFVVQAMIARNLFVCGLSVIPATLLTALGFGFVHWPDHFLMGATFALALLLTPIYLRRKRIVPLGLCHGWLGVLAYYWLLGRDPIRELFG